MATGFAQLFWGLLLVILDFSINGFDILPDGIGYLIVAAGCLRLSQLSLRFSVARTLSFVLAGLWLLGLAVYNSDFGLIYGFAATLVNCAMMWQLLGGIGEFAASSQRHDLANKASVRRTAYVVIMIGTNLLGLGLSGSRNGGALVVILVIAMIVLMIMILHLIHRVKVELALAGSL